MLFNSKSFLFINIEYLIVGQNLHILTDGQGKIVKQTKIIKIQIYATIQILCLSLRLMYHERYIIVATTIINAKPPNFTFTLSHKVSSFCTDFSI